MKSLFIILILFYTLFADVKRVCFYTTENNINNFKSLKVNFDNYLQEFGKYEFQAFSDKQHFEECISINNSIVILSSWHYKNIATKYKIQANLVAQKKNKITDTKVFITKKGKLLSQGILASAYNKEHTLELAENLIKKQNFSFLQVPKELDALMSVSFSMSEFAIVSKDSFLLLQETNEFLAKNLQIHKESQPLYRLLIASSNRDNKKENFSDIFTSMYLNETGKKILNILGVDKIVALTKDDLKKIRGIK